MTNDLRTFLLGALGLPSVLMACGPTVGTVTVPQPPNPLEPYYGECDPVLIDSLDEVDDETPVEVGLYLRCSTDIDRETCISDCGNECVQGIIGFDRLNNPNYHDVWSECGPVYLDEGCCVAMRVEEFCCEGRPFLVGGTARMASPASRTDWMSAVEPAAVDAPTAAALSAHWCFAGQQEHASIAAFSRFSLVLLHLGAPAELVAAAHTASLDEVRHAQACFALASAYGQAPVGPGPLRMDAALTGELDPKQAFITLFKEGCVGETLASLIARAGAESATDPVVREVLHTIAAEEAQHAALAWKTARWMLGRFPDLGVELDELMATITAPTAPPQAIDLSAHGVLTPAAKQALLSDAMDKIVRPLAAQLQAALPHPVEPLVVGDPTGAGEGPRRRSRPSDLTV